MRSRSAPHRAPPDTRQRTDKVFGLAAVRAVLAVRPGDVRQIAHTREARAEVADVLRAAARQRIAYREVPREEMERLADSVHHEGVCMLVDARAEPTPAELATRLRAGGFVLMLDGVENPHNVGAVLRSAAYFGARGLVVGGTRQRGLTPASVRVAEGGAEHVPVCFVPELDAALAAFEAVGAHIIGTDAQRGTTLAKLRWPERTVLVLGSERVGLSTAVRKRCTAIARIAGSGALDSLNVSVAAGVLMAACCQAADE